MRADEVEKGRGDSYRPAGHKRNWNRSQEQRGLLKDLKQKIVEWLVLVLFIFTHVMGKT
jgi:hypothetical protein